MITEYILWDLELEILLDGDITLFTEHKPYVLHKGYYRSQVHSFSSGGERSLILAFQIDTDFYRKINFELGFLWLENNIIRSGHLHDVLYQSLLSCAECYFSPAPFSEIKCLSLLLDSLHLLLSNSHHTLMDEKEYYNVHKNSQRINRITAYITEHYQDSISLNDIADMEGISAYHLSHFMKKILGISFQVYLNNVRFEHALRLIQKTSLSLFDICMETGFSNTRYLNQMFQKKFNCNALEYRKADIKPSYQETILPIDNIQSLYSFEQSAFQFHRLLL